MQRFKVTLVYLAANKPTRRYTYEMNFLNPFGRIVIDWAKHRFDGYGRPRVIRIRRQ